MLGEGYQGEVFVMEKWDREPLTDAEVSAIFDATTNMEDRLIVAFLADTGCRVNELIRSRPGWVDYSSGKYGIITVPVEATSGKLAKTKKVKVISITRRLRECIEECEGLGLSRTPQHVYNVVKRLAKGAGVTKHVTPHVFRHTRACKLYYDTEMTVEEIGHYLGHANGDMVKNVYLHIDDAKVKSKLESSGVLD